MGDFQPFGYKGEPGTCLWCGRKLRHQRIMASESDKDNPTLKAEGSAFFTIRAVQAGAYQDDSFCGLRCGYQFGRRLARLGSRLHAGTDS